MKFKTIKIDLDFVEKEQIVKAKENEKDINDLLKSPLTKFKEKIDLVGDSVVGSVDESYASYRTFLFVIDEGKKIGMYSTDMCSMLLEKQDFEKFKYWLDSSFKVNEEITMKILVLSFTDEVINGNDKDERFVSLVLDTMVEKKSLDVMRSIMMDLTNQKRLNQQAKNLIEKIVETNDLDFAFIGSEEETKLAFLNTWLATIMLKNETWLFRLKEKIGAPRVKNENMIHSIVMSIWRNEEIIDLGSNKWKKSMRWLVREDYSTTGMVFNDTFLMVIMPLGESSKRKMKVESGELIHNPNVELFLNEFKRLFDSQLQKIYEEELRNNLNTKVSSVKKERF